MPGSPSCSRQLKKSAVTTSVTVISFCVNVPVLSEQITFTQPSVSTWKIGIRIQRYYQLRHLRETSRAPSSQAPVFVLDSQACLRQDFHNVRKISNPGPATFCADTMSVGSGIRWKLLCHSEQGYSALSEEQVIRIRRLLAPTLTIGSFFTMAFRFAIRITPRARVTVTTIGRPSGMAATARDTPMFNIDVNGFP